MFFLITNRFGNYPEGTKNKVILTWDEWNDYSYYTAFGIIYIDENGEQQNIGGIRIAYYGQETGSENKKLEQGDEFETLGNEYFSLGTDDNYYDNLNKLGEERRDKILTGLKDIAKSNEIFDKAINEEVTKISLLRDISVKTVVGQFRKIANGGSRLTDYHFQFTLPLVVKEFPQMCMTFNVLAESSPPTNIQVIIGRNGVGKTYLINNMVNSLLTLDEQYGKFEFTNIKEELSFANIVCITFSAFDDFKLNQIKPKKDTTIEYHYIGLKETIKEDANIVTKTKDPQSLKIEFIESLNGCIVSFKISRWYNAILALETDPMFKEERITQLAENLIDWKEKANAIFDRLSSGHKIILLTITRLVETLQEKSLVFIDEPESHLHPPLLSSFIRSLSGLLINRNAVCIIATHSPVILQEVPSSCVWKLRRNGAFAIAERLEIQSFGENVGVLTNEVFGLEVTDSGFYKILNEILQKYPSYDDAIASISNQLGLEGKSILRSLYYQKNNPNEENRRAAL